MAPDRLRAAVVDDDVRVRDLARETLTRRGYTVVDADSGAGALALAEDSLDVMILGLELRDQTGPAVWESLRGGGAAAPFPILFTSSTVDARTIGACLTPYSDWLRLPCDAAELQARVDRLVRTHSRDDTVLQRSALYDVLRDETAQTLLQHHVSGLRVLGSGLAHEMNSPLAALMTSLEFAASATGAEHDEAVADAAAAAKRLATVVKRTQSMGASTDATVTLELRALLQEVAAAFAAEAAVVEIVGPEAPIVAVRSELWALFNALLENAVEAASPGGRVVVTVSLRPHVVDVTIDDTGRGIGDEDLPFVFDLFFTKKHRWSSIGLGLPIAQAAAHRHGGFVFVDGKGPLGGARVSVLLPQRETSGIAASSRRAIRRGIWSGGG